MCRPHTVLTGIIFSSLDTLMCHFPQFKVKYIDGTSSYIEICDISGRHALTAVAIEQQILTLRTRASAGGEEHALAVRIVYYFVNPCAWRPYIK
jgi:hypothetical protein